MMVASSVTTVVNLRSRDISTLDFHPDDGGGGPPELRLGKLTARPCWPRRNPMIVPNRVSTGFICGWLNPTAIAATPRVTTRVTVVFLRTSSAGALTLQRRA